MFQWVVARWCCHVCMCPPGTAGSCIPHALQLRQPGVQRAARRVSGGGSGHGGWHSRVRPCTAHQFGANQGLFNALAEFATASIPPSPPLPTHVSRPFSALWIRCWLWVFKWPETSSEPHSQGEKWVDRKIWAPQIELIGYDTRLGDKGIRETAPWH